MRITVHVKTQEEAETARAKYVGPEYAGDDVEIIVDQPVSPRPAERQDRQSPRGEF